MSDRYRKASEVYGAAVAETIDALEKAVLSGVAIEVIEALVVTHHEALPEGFDVREFARMARGRVEEMLQTVDTYLAEVGDGEPETVADARKLRAFLTRASIGATFCCEDEPTRALLRQAFAIPRERAV